MWFQRIDGIASVYYYHAKRIEAHKYRATGEAREMYGIWRMNYWLLIFCFDS